MPLKQLRMGVMSKVMVWNLKWNFWTRKYFLENELEQSRVNNDDNAIHGKCSFDAQK